MNLEQAITDLIERGKTLTGGASWTKDSISRMAVDWEEAALEMSITAEEVQRFTKHWMQTKAKAPTLADLCQACGKAPDSPTSFTPRYGVIERLQPHNGEVRTTYEVCVMRNEAAKKIRETGQALNGFNAWFIEESTDKRTIVFTNRDEMVKWLNAMNCDPNGFPIISAAEKQANRERIKSVMA